MKRAPSISATPRARRQILLACLFALPVFAQSGPFSMHDSDRNGYLEREEYQVLLELRRHRGRQHGRMAGQPAPAFEEIDQDRDGRIDEQELTDMLHHKMYRYRRQGPAWRWDGG